MNWFCVQTKPLKEAFAARYLQGVLGLDTYLPMLHQRRVIRRVKRTVISPLFPHYLFCRFDTTTHLRAVRYAPDVASIVQSSGLPTVVHDQIVDDLKVWAARAVAGDPAQPVLRPGEMVLITDGVMGGLQAVFLREMSDRERVEVLLSVLDCGARMVVGRDQIRRVS